MRVSFSDAMATRYRVSDIERYLDFRCFREIVLVSAQLYNAELCLACRLADIVFNCCVVERLEGIRTAFKSLV